MLAEPRAVSWTGDLLGDHIPEELGSGTHLWSLWYLGGNDLQVTAVSVPSSLVMGNLSD